MQKTGRESTGRQWLPDILFDILGCGIFSIAIQCFSAPNQIAPGGVSGVSILINYLTGLPISALSFLLNIPLLVLAWFFLGRSFTLRTLKTVAVLTVMLEVATFLPAYQGNLILAALYGGVLEGLGLSLIFLRSSTTGGTDIASRLIQLKFPHVPVGRLMMSVDALVLLASAIVYRNIENALYGMIAIFAYGRIVDSILYGIDAGKVLLIVTHRYEELARQINDRMGRGCTLLKAAGSYTGEERPVLMVAVRKPQIVELKKLVQAEDPNAFLMALDASEIIGEGFKDHEEPDRDRGGRKAQS